MGRYVRHTTTWLRGQVGSFDLLLADAGREEASAAIEAAGSSSTPTIVRVAGWGSECDTKWWKTSRAAKRCAGVIKLADRVVISSAAAHRDLIQDGFDNSRVARVDLGFSGSIARSSKSRSLARHALGSMNSDLNVPDDVVVAACVGRMTRTSGMHALSKSVRQLAEKHHHLHVWFIGDGAYRETMYDYLRGEGVRSVISMPGSFSNVADVLSAADIYVQCDDAGLDYLLPSAVSAEMPLVMIDNDSTRQWLAGPSDVGDASSCVQWVGKVTAAALQKGVDQVVSRIDPSRERAAELRRILLRRQPLDQMLDRYVRLIQETITSGAAGSRATSFGAVS